SAAVDPPPGCRFAPRCPYAMDICKQEDPPYKDVGGNHFASCYLL
ncbi:MAG: peptide ABC transporter substrate-binding protein, partial [Theionarchaea archaeon]|nr:peptide ABC transporter substrate-binding protein [Theionarchaea archaeon]MBU7019056.1 peptide ABC transporter substrate-binding protein [Theionarchaea archaeon]